MTTLFAFLPSTAAFIAGGYLAAHKVEGWGWFLFVGLVVAYPCARAVMK